MTKMTLYSSLASPFGRKVQIALAELGRSGEVDIVQCNPWDSPAELLAANPLSKIPTLVIGPGQTLFDSSAICDWLDAKDGRHRLLPAEPGARAVALRRQALADSLLDAAIVILLNRAQKPERVHRGFVARQEQVIARGLDALEKEAAALEAGFDLGHIAIICMLDFMTQSKIGEWRAGRPHLAAWLDRIRQRPTVAANPAAQNPFVN